MNKKNQKLRPRIETENRFELTPAPPAAFRALQETELERLKNRLLRQTLDELTGADTNGFVRRAANEAAALAWDTRFPLLVFPGLFEEKAANALRQVQRQLNIRSRSRQLLFV
jgi:hypothetical protein